MRSSTALIRRGTRCRCCPRHRRFICSFPVSTRHITYQMTPADRGSQCIGRLSPFDEAQLGGLRYTLLRKQLCPFGLVCTAWARSGLERPTNGAPPTVEGGYKPMAQDWNPQCLSTSIHSPTHTLTFDHEVPRRPFRACLARRCADGSHSCSPRSIHIRTWRAVHRRCGPTRKSSPSRLNCCGSCWVCLQDTLTGSQEVSVAIGLLSCVGRAPLGTCDGIDFTEQIGTALYAGPYAPQLRPGGSDLFENFTVTVPEGFPSGAASLVVAHFSLVGVSLNRFPDMKWLLIVILYAGSQLAHA